MSGPDKTRKSCQAATVVVVVVVITVVAVVVVVGVTRLLWSYLI